MKILILALSGIGDALMFTPALKLLRAQLPDAQIDVLVMFKGAQDIFINNSNINNVYRFDFLREGSVKSLKYILSLRRNYDTSINVYPSNRKEYNIISILIGAKNRAAIKYFRKDFSNLGFLNSIRISENDSVHNVQTNIKLIEKLLDNKFDEEPALDLFITEEDETREQKLFSEKNILKDDHSEVRQMSYMSPDKIDLLNKLEKEYKQDQKYLPNKRKMSEKAQKEIQPV